MILFRYLAKETFVTMFVVISVVLVISMGWRFSGYLEKAAAGNMASEILFSLMIYRLPGFLELIIPVGFFLAILLAHGRLHAEREMIVLHACGVSEGRILRMTLVLALLVMLFTAAFALWLKPLAEQRVEALLTDQTVTEFDTLLPGRFQTFGSGQGVIWTEEFSDEGQLRGVFINEYSKPTAPNQSQDAATVISSTGSTRVDENGRRFLVLKDGTRHQGVPGQRGYQVVRYEEYGQLVETEETAAGKVRLTAIPTLDLLGAVTAEYLSELHWRIAVILTVPVVALMALPLARVNPRQGRFNHLVPAMILCFLYIVSLSSARSGLENGTLPLALGLWWVHGIFLLVVVWLHRLKQPT